jgi:hypothetical protein
VTDEQAVRLVRLRPELINIIGFYGLMDDGRAATPLDALRHQVHFTASSVKVAQEVMEIVNELWTRPDFDQTAAKARGRFRPVVWPGLY